MRQRYSISLRDDHRARFQAEADDRDLSLSDWIIQACLSYSRLSAGSKVKHAANSKWPSGWPRSAACFHCGEQHDPLEAHPAFGKADIKYQLKQLKEANDLVD